MIRVVITGEGPTDYGWKEYGEDKWHEGAATILLRRILTTNFPKSDIEINFIDKNDLSKENRPKFQRKIKGLRGRGIPCFFFLTTLKEKFNSCNDNIVPVFYTDADKESGKDHTTLSSCERLYKDRCIEVEEASELANIGCIPMVPMKMIECWLLSDGNAITEVLGCKVTKLPDKPELIWGEKNNLNSNYPKNYLARILKEANYGELVEDKSITFAEIAENIDLQILNNKCFISFADFYKRCIETFK